MRPLPTALALAAVMLGGCLHQGATPTAAPAGAPPSAGVGASTKPARARPVQIYVGTGGTPTLAAVHAGAVALALRDELRSRGFDVRGADALPPSGEAGAAASSLARAITDGQPAPASVRTLTYLHPNAPRLLLLIHLQENPITGDITGARPAVILGGLLADSEDGTVLWSARVTEPAPADDRRLRHLAERLLETLPTPAPQG